MLDWRSLVLQYERMYTTPERLRILDDVTHWTETAVCTDVLEYANKERLIRVNFIEVISTEILEEHRSSIIDETPAVADGALQDDLASISSASVPPASVSS
jgi:hypothetical protein